MQADGSIISTFDYDIYGKEKTTQEGTIKNPYRYAGEYYDEESGLYYLKARYYDPSIGRFISKDTYEGDIKDLLSLNLYTYCMGNPLKYVDHDGHEIQLASEENGYHYTYITRAEADRIMGIVNGFWSFGFSITPVAGDIKDWQEVVTGVDLLTGERITGLDKGITVVCAFIPIVGGKVGREGVGLLTEGTGKLINKTSKSFWKSYNKLPNEIKKQADEAFRLFKENPNLKGLNFEQLEGGKFYSVRINQKYRAYGRRLLNGYIEWIEINGHNYKKAIRMLKNMD